MARITVVNDNPDFLDLMRDLLEDERYTVTTIDGDLPDAVERIVASLPHLLVIDLRVGTERLHGWNVVQGVRATEQLAALPVVLCSADLRALRELETELEGHNWVTSLTKPFRLGELMDTIRSSLIDPAPA